MRTSALVLLAACSGKDDGPTGGDSSPATPTGPAEFRISIDLDPDLVPAMDEPAVGVFRGSVFAEADATSFGPVEGAASLLDFTTEELDFDTTGGLRETATTVGPVDPQIVWILGCFDTAGDDCETGDPITIPNENKLEVTSATESLTLTLSLLQP